MKQLLLPFLLILAGTLCGQDVIRQQFDWQDTPLTYRVGDEQVQQWSFAGAVFDDAAPSHPYWVYRLPLSGPGKLEVQLAEASWADHPKMPAPEDEQLTATLRFHTQVVREPEGYFAKISCVPITQTADGYRRVQAFTLRTRFISQGEGRGGPSNSVLRDGEVYQIAISESGIYRLSYSFIKDELGISNLDDIDPRNLRLYGNPGGLVPYDINAERPLDLLENAIYVEGEADGSFDGSDYVLFYAEGPHKWRYEPEDDRYRLEENIYSNRNYYFLKVSGERGQRISEQDNLASTTYTTDSYEGLLRYGEDKLNPLHEIETIATGSGQRWYGDFFKFAREKDYSEFFDLSGLVSSEPVVVRAEMALRAKVNSRFFLDINGQTLTSGLASRVRINEDGEIFDELAVTTRLNGNVALNNENLNLILRYPHPGGGEQSEAWLDYIQLRPRLQLRYPGQGQLRFQDSRSYTQASTTFQLSGAESGVEIWDITNPGQPRRQTVSRSGDQASFGVSTLNQLRTFVAFRPEEALTTAEAIGSIPAQNLHNLASQDMLIIYHPELEEAALRLAEHRRSHDNLTVTALPSTQVYNEYASGRAEPTAIRDFAFDIFMREGELRYLLLLGDGSFDNRDIYGLGSNLIPVYQNDRNHELFGYPADDYYAIFANEPGRNPLAADLSIGVGRLPAKTASEANAMVEKVIQYDTNPEYMLDWRTRMTFLGDDEDGATHSDDAELAVSTVSDISPIYNPAKLFFDLFPQESTAAGDRFPAVEAELERAIFRGSVVTTYLGHGGPRGWAQERVLDIPTIQNWRNADRLSLFLTATCTFGDFDNSAFVSAGEELILNSRGGAIGLLTTTRPVFANRNSALTNNSLRELLRQEEDGSRQRLGDVIRRAKNALSSPNAFDNERKFMLMGDPAQRIALPRFQVLTNTINGLAPDSVRRDTLRALEEVTVTGQIADLAGNLMTNFNGTVYPTVYDKSVPATTLRNDPEGSPERTYMVRKNVLFRGRAEVRNGTFSFSFIMPKDINFAYGPGKISYYAADTNQGIDAGGSEERFLIGGSNPEGLANDTPPLVEVFMNSEDFVAGSRVDANPLLVVKLSDDLGINVAGNSIGHDLEGFLNEDTQNSYLLNDFYEAETGDYTKGEVRFPLRDLEAGTYTMKVRAWDVANNVGEGQTEFIVAGDGKIALERVLNYPNPFTDRTCFQFDSSLAGEDLEVLIQIYTVSGRQVKTIEALLPANDGALRLDDCIEWDGRDDYGDILGRGVYLYKVRVRTATGEDMTGESEFEKLVILK